jgi:predicted aspartyl protease
VIPFDFSRQVLVAQVDVCGKGPYTVMLDTGTSPSVIDVKLARSLGLKLEAVGQGEGGGVDSNPTFSTTIPAVGFAKKVDALAMDLSSLGRNLGRHLDAVLGDSFFKPYVVTFDYPHHRVTLSHLLSRQKRPILHSSFTEADGELRIQGVKINGRRVLANVDTGSNSLFSLTPRAIDRLGLLEIAAKATVTKSAGFNGSYSSRTGVVDSIQVGKVRLKEPKVGFWMRGTGHDTRPWDVNVGNRFLQNYVLVVDYPHHQLWLVKATY